MILTRLHNVPQPLCLLIRCTIDLGNGQGVIEDAGQEFDGRSWRQWLEISPCTRRTVFRFQVSDSNVDVVREDPVVIDLGKMTADGWRLLEAEAELCLR